MKQNLALLFGFPDTPAGTSKSATPSSPPQPPPRIALTRLEAIEGALSRLNHLGSAIKRTSLSGQITKAREFAESFDLSSFEQAAYLSLTSLYPDATQTLLEALTASMADTYSLFLRRKHRHERFQAHRSRLQPRILPRITEALSEDPESQKFIKNPQKEPSLRKHLLMNATQPHTVPISAPTSLDSREVQSRFQKLLNPSIKERTGSIVSRRTNYPQPVKGSLTCEWCFNPLPEDSFNGVLWRQHVNTDHEPFVCLSERCSKTLPRYASSTQWFQHMHISHGEDWHRQVHAPLVWSCPLCTDSDTKFSNSRDLADHLNSFHANTFTELQTQAIVEQTPFPYPREYGVCPLCSFGVGAKDARPDSKPASSEESPREVQQLGPKKRIKLTESLGKRSQNNDSGPANTDRAQASNTDTHCSAGNGISAEAIGSHVAAHLQGIMLLTLRLISIDLAMDTSADRASIAGSTSAPSSLSGLSKRSLLPWEELDDLPAQNNDENDKNADTASQDVIPDSDYIGWQNVLPWFGSLSQGSEARTSEALETQAQAQPSCTAGWYYSDDEELSPHTRPKAKVRIFLLNSLNEFVIGARRHGSGTGLCWYLPGGTIEYGESFESCVVRKAMEQTGLGMDGLRFLTVTNDIIESKGAHHVSAFYEGRVLSDAQPEILKPNKWFEWRWMSWSEIQSAFHAHMVASEWGNESTSFNLSASLISLCEQGYSRY
ncbi:hypothetical protein BJY01DRAFT_63055 [Aspergillus pseudoustus]|uniref:Nudix hydrolase domain-containing protein n=1 Tax=Aspergillus pseudoustus TaxID=1810923 RepID=A0ABR4J7F7_9EURO